MSPPQEPDSIIGPKETDTVIVPKEERTVVDSKEASSKEHTLGLILGFRTGLSIPTQKVIQDFGNSTSIGPLINVEALYAIREWVRVGMMVEWHRHSIKMWGPEFGTLNTVSILPTVEIRPTRTIMAERGIEACIPYASLGLGVNSNSLSEGSGLGSARTSFQDTFALRVAGGLDFPITSQWSLNGEVAWNKNAGDYQLNATEGRFNASTLNLLVAYGPSSKGIDRFAYFTGAESVLKLSALTPRDYSAPKSHKRRCHLSSPLVFVTPVASSRFSKSHAPTEWFHLNIPRSQLSVIGPNGTHRTSIL